VVVDSWRPGLMLNAVVLWNTRCTEGLGGSRLGDDRGHDGGLHHLTRGQRHNGDQDQRNRGHGWKQVHEQETANATIGAFPWARLNPGARARAREGRGLGGP
jgi:hypothetical protein